MALQESPEKRKESLVSCEREKMVIKVGQEGDREQLSMEAGTLGRENQTKMVGQG